MLLACTFVFRAVISIIVDADKEEDKQSTVSDHRPKFGERVCLDSEALCFMSFFKPPNSKDADNCTDQIRVITVEFNAWEYSGCDYLWAGIVTNLGSKVEEFFGTWKVRLCRLLLEYTSDGVDGRATSMSVQCGYLRCKAFLFCLLVLSCLVYTTTFVVLVGTQADILDTLKQGPYIAAIVTFVTAFSTLLGGKKRFAHWAFCSKL